MQTAPICNFMPDIVHVYACHRLMHSVETLELEDEHIDDDDDDDIDDHYYYS